MIVPLKELEYKAGLDQNPWVNISDSEYEEILKIVQDLKFEQLKSKIFEQK